MRGFVDALLGPFSVLIIIVVVAVVVVVAFDVLRNVFFVKYTRYGLIEIVSPSFKQGIPDKVFPFRLDFPLSLSPLTPALFIRFLSSLLTTIIPSFHV